MKRKQIEHHEPANKKQKLGEISIFNNLDYLLQIFHYLEPKDLNNIRTVCKFWYEAQKLEFFVNEYCNRLNLIHNQYVETFRETKRHSVVDRVFYQLGYKQGIQESWRITDQKLLASTTTFKNNKKEGRYQSFFKDGRLMRECYYKADKLHGPCKIYQIGKNNEHLLKVECSYFEGKIDGVFKEYTKEGKLEKYMEFKKGKKHGKAEEYTKEGYLHRSCYFEDGKMNGLFIEYYKNTNQKKKEFEYLKGKEHGKCTKWYENGNEQSVSYYKNGKREKHTEYFKNGGVFLRN